MYVQTVGYAVSNGGSKERGFLSFELSHIVLEALVIYFQDGVPLARGDSSVEWDRKSKAVIAHSLAGDK